MKKAINLKELEANYLWMLDGENDDALITTEQAAKVVGVCLRTMRNWEAKGKAPPREPEGCYPRRYRLGDIKALAKRHKQEQALLILGYGPSDIEYLYSRPRHLVRDMFVKCGLHPSLWP